MVVEIMKVKMQKLGAPAIAAYLYWRMITQKATVRANTLLPINYHKQTIANKLTPKNSCKTTEEIHTFLYRLRHRCHPATER